MSIRDGLDRFNPYPIVRLHFRSMRDVHSNRLSPTVVAVQVVVPLLGGVGLAVAVAYGLPLRDGLPQLLAGGALLFGALVSAFIFLTNLRIKVSESATYNFRVRMHRLIGASAVGCLYTSGVTLSLTLILTAAANLPALRSGVPRVAMAGLVGFVGLHLLVNLLNIVRGLLGVYWEFFASDFDDVVNDIGAARPSRRARRAS